MSYFIKVSPLLQALIKEIEESSSDDLSYELWRDVCIHDGWVEVNVQQDDWVDSIKDDTKRELVMHNELSFSIIFNTVNPIVLLNINLNPAIMNTYIPPQFV